MAFKLRAEFWTAPDASTAIGAPLLRTTIANAVEIDADTEEPIALPVAENRAAYVMAVTAIDGDTTVQVGAAGDAYSPARGRLVTEGAKEWFIVEPDSYAEVTEYPAA